jgi:hypothetical protein
LLKAAISQQDQQIFVASPIRSLSIAAQEARKDSR